MTLTVARDEIGRIVYSASLSYSSCFFSSTRLSYTDTLPSSNDEKRLKYQDLSSKNVPPRKPCSRISRIVPSRRTRVPPLPPLSPSSTSEDSDTTSLAVPPLPDEEVAVSSGIQRLSTPTSDALPFFEASKDLSKSVDDAALNLVQLACSTVRVSTSAPSHSTINHRENDDEVAVAAKLLIVTLTPIPTVMSPRTGSRHPTVLTSHPIHPSTTIVVVTLVVTFKGADHA
ncbi:hypothetical transcript [Echinococcus multilocularis]|uniref:Hypothetical transcript n=1 Tax=Echinococcus multilocularis TaxID=6211 RepID=A0A0S4MNA5_ECHMU|nr:hypothetical transcript [Echinococcus multilocularis]